MFSDDKKLIQRLELSLNFVHVEIWSSAGSVRLSAHAEVLPANTIREQDTPTTNEKL